MNLYSAAVKYINKKNLGCHNFEFLEINKKSEPKIFWSEIVSILNFFLLDNFSSLDSTRKVTNLFAFKLLANIPTFLSILNETIESYRIR